MCAGSARGESSVWHLPWRGWSVWLPAFQDRAGQACEQRTPCILACALESLLLRGPDVAPRGDHVVDIHVAFGLCRLGAAVADVEPHHLIFRLPHRGSER